MTTTTPIPDVPTTTPARVALSACARGRVTLGLTVGLLVGLTSCLAGCLAGPQQKVVYASKYASIDVEPVTLPGPPSRGEAKRALRVAFEGSPLRLREVTTRMVPAPDGAAGDGTGEAAGAWLLTFETTLRYGRDAARRRAIVSTDIRRGPGGAVESVRVRSYEDIPLNDDWDEIVVPEMTRRIPAALARLAEAD